MMDGYKFRFASQAGSDYTINLRPTTGWSGRYKSRAMGASPVLRRERNGAILGSSLTLRLECLEDGEYAVLYTSSPYEWLAELYLNGNVLVWRGYVSPELYSAPDMAPPYDVEIIATDGLGELKRASYTQDGPMTLHDILKVLLNTAQQDDLPIMWRLDYTSDGCNGSNYLTAVSLDLTSQSGRSCYDVLSDLLASMHAMIMYDGGEWLVINECDLPTDGAALTLHEGNTGNDVSLSPQALGGVWWPVGKLSDKVVSAKREVALVTTAITRELMPDPTLTSQGGAGQMEDGTLLGGSGNSRIVQEVYVGNVYSRATKLVLELEATGNGSLIVDVTGKCSDTSVPVAHSGPWTVGSVVLQNGVPVMSVGEGGHWISGEPVTTNVIAITPDGDKLSMSLVLPTDEIHIYAEDDGYGGIHYSLGAMHDIETYLDTISVSVAPDTGSCKVTRMSLHEVPGYRGTETTVKLANGARDAASSVDTLVSSDIDGADTGTLAILREGVPMVGGKALRKWGGSYDYVAYMGTMYARSNALPAVDKTGILNVPAGTSYIPLMWTQLGVVYMLRRYDWQLIADELTINEMVSLPVASITVESITTQYTSESSGSSSGSGPSSSGSSGGVSGGLKSVGLIMPDPFAVSGSPLTEDGNIKVSLLEGYTIPKAAQMSDALKLNNELMSGWLLAAPPRVCIIHPHKGITADYRIEITHPLQHLRGDAEIVLMVYSRNDSRRVTRQGQGEAYYKERKKWSVANGRLSSELPGGLQPLVSSADYIYINSLSTFIAQRFTVIDGYSDTQMMSVTLDTWRTSAANIGWGSKYKIGGKHSKLFGWAVRVPNPAFTALVDSSKQLAPTTQAIHGVPRYFYTAVTPMPVRINDRRGQGNGYNYVLGYDVGQ